MPDSNSPMENYLDEQGMRLSIKEIQEMIFYLMLFLTDPGNRELVTIPSIPSTYFRSIIKDLFRKAAEKGVEEQEYVERLLIESDEREEEEIIQSIENLMKGEDSRKRELERLNKDKQFKAIVHKRLLQLKAEINSAKPTS